MLHRSGVISFTRDDIVRICVTYIVMYIEYMDSHYLWSCSMSLINLYSFVNLSLTLTCGF